MEPLAAESAATELRPAQICQALLAALEASEGRRRRRKRDQTPDAIGLALKRQLLEHAVREDPEPARFEQWLLSTAVAIEAGSASPGAARAMARNIFEEWQMSLQLENFRAWLDAGAPSDDAGDPKTERQEAEPLQGRGNIS